jgi:thioredoxin 1|tara:strand:+ start:574 stop:900 length:327 start_codon:yes stop_codon:yes gene_type:complete
MGNNTLVFTDSNFNEEVVSSELPSLVDFWAEWCAPCKSIAPVVEELAKEYQSKAKIGKLNVDENPKTATQYGIRGIPTLLLFKEGKVVQQMVGVKSKTEIQKVLDSVI